MVRGRGGRRDERRWRTGAGRTALAVGGLAAAVVGSAACTAGSGSGTAGTTAGTPATSAPPAPVTWTDTTVDVGGVPVAVRCAGAGPKTVVFVAGVGETGQEAWGASGVPEAIAHQARACTYDRPGLGASGAATTDRTVANHTAELGALVQAGAFPGPLVLVGQGYGTVIARQYAREHRREMAGLVLVDPPLEALDATPPDGATPGVAAEYAGLADLDANLGAYGAGALPPPPAPTVILGRGDLPPLPPGRPAGTPTTRAADGGAPPSGAAVTAMPGDQRRAEQEQLARKGPFSSYRLVPDAGTYIQYWQPQAVTDAITAVLAGRH